MGDDEVDVLVLEGDEVYFLSLVFHHFGEVVEDVPVLLGVELADDTDGLNLLDVVDALVAWGSLQVANDSLAAKVFNEFQHITIIYYLLSIYLIY